MKNIFNKVLVMLMFVVALAPYFYQGASEKIQNTQTINVNGKEVAVQIHDGFVKIDGMELEYNDPTTILSSLDQIMNSKANDLILIERGNVMFVYSKNYMYYSLDKHTNVSTRNYGYFLYNKNINKIMFCIEPSSLKIGPSSGGVSSRWNSLSDEDKNRISLIANAAQDLSLSTGNERFAIAGQMLIHQTLSSEFDIFQPADINDYINHVNAVANELGQTPSFNNQELTLNYDFEQDVYVGSIVDNNNVINKYYQQINGVSLNGITFNLEDNKLKVTSDNPIIEPITIDSRFKQGLTSNTHSFKQAEFINSASYQDAMINQPTGSDYSFSIKTNQAHIKGIKTDENNNPLSGVEFSLYADTNDNQVIDETDKLVSTINTNDQGEISFNTLPLGNYIVKETKSKEGYINQGYEECIRLEVDNLTYMLNNNQPIINKEIKGNIIVNKIDQDNNPLSDVEFSIYDDTNNNQQIDEDEVEVVKGISDKEGVINFDDIKYGNYILKETKGKEGYIVNEENINFSINEDNYQEKQVFDVVNEKINEKHSLIDSKSIPESGQPDSFVNTGIGQVLEDILFILICVGMIYLYRIKN